jgi:hypothetical protein
MNWMLAKGDRVEEGKMLHIQLAATVQVSTLSHGTKYFSDELFYCADDEPPSRMELGEYLTLLSEKNPTNGSTGVKELCRVEYAIKCSKLSREPSYRHPETGEKWRDAVLDLFISLNDATLHFIVAYKNESLGYTEAKYKEDF